MCGSELGPRLTDFQDKRLRLMDASGVEIMILSLNAPAVQAIFDVKRAIAVAREANDVLAAEIAKRPDRFAGFAALPMQDPDAAARELTRCVKELGFVGALVNGFSQAGRADSALYYDLPQYRPFWRTVAELDVPFYLHPRNPLPGAIPGYDGHNWLLGPNWAFHAETAVHALRLIGAGLFDEHPKLQIILGHLGEGIPAYLWRIDHRNDWMKARHKYAAKKWVADYFRRQLRADHLGQLLHLGAEPGDRRDRGRARAVVGGLSVRGHQRRGRLVRCGAARRSRPAEDRPHQCAETVQTQKMTEDHGMKFASIAAAALLLAGTATSRAEIGEITIAQQFGVVVPAADADGARPADREARQGRRRRGEDQLAEGRGPERDQ